MLEISETRTIAKQLRKEILGKKITDLGGNFTDHKFTFYYDDPNKYKEKVINKKVTNIIDRNAYVEIVIEDYTLILRDGANIRYYKDFSEVPSKSKLMLVFDDGTILNITTSMYSFIAIFNNKNNFNDKYYLSDINGIGPLDKRFTYEYFNSLRNPDTIKLSAKAFIATSQRIPGIGNGISQDILFNAKINPKRKINTLSENEFKTLYDKIVNTITKMINDGGRDTEKDIYGENFGYKTILSSKTLNNPCPQCGGKIIKENFLGGSIYRCDNCQK